MDDLDTRISDFLTAAQAASIDLGCLAENAEDMGLTRATAIAIAQANPQKAADFVSMLADFLTEIDNESDGMVVSDGFVAVQLLGHLGPLAAPAIPAIDRCIGLDGSHEELVRWLRLMAAEAKWRITGDPATALAVAMELLNDEEWWLIGHAADLLGKLGQAARPAVADLERLLGHENEFIQKHVRAAMEKIEVS